MNTDFTGVQVSFSPKDQSVLAPLEIQSLVGHGPYSGDGSHGQAKLHTSVQRTLKPLVKQLLCSLHLRRVGGETAKAVPSICFVNCLSF